MMVSIHARAVKRARLGLLATLATLGLFQSTRAP